MKYCHILHTLLPCFFLLAGCAGVEDNPVRESVEEEGEKAARPRFENALIVQTESDDTPQLEGFSFERVFSGDPEFEQRHREAGLHKWYFAIPVEDIPATRAEASLGSLPGIKSIEKPLPAVADAFLFNDPYLNRQWHLLNDASLHNKFVQGIDINVLPVWKQFTAGGSAVTVAVVDSGIEYDHTDLSGVVLPPGKDGSKSFLWDHFFSPYDYESSRHGTHVAGIIGAINNNGTGVCGIAGGSNGTGGVKIIDCQAIGSSSNMYDAFVWAADKGAVIINNSWNGDYKTVSDVPEETDDSYKTAIDYFVKYAGTDKYGNQTGPMQGGLVVFSAGNKGWDRQQPTMYEKNISVGAVGPAGEATSYTCYGPWVDICAPGGNDGSTYGSSGLAQIYSTMQGKGYYQMQGTSQAAPMVSGVAALIVSYFGKEGFTCDDLRDILLKGADREIPARHNKAIGPMLDAYGSFLYASGAPLKTADGLSVNTRTAGKATISWNIMSYGTQPMYAYKVFLAESPNGLANADPFNPPAGVRVQTLVTYNSTAKTASVTFDGIQLDKNYYFSVVGYTRSHLYTKDNTVKNFFVRTNTPPVLTSDYSAPVSITHSQTATIKAYYSDAEGDQLTFTLDPGSNAGSWTDDGNGRLTLSIDGSKASAGSYSAKVTADDGMETTSVSFIYTILPNRNPVLKLEKPVIGQVKYNETAEALVRCSDADGDRLGITTTPGSAAGTWDEAEPGLYRLSINGKGAPAGTYTASITADDGHGGTVSLNISYSLKGGNKPVLAKSIKNFPLTVGGKPETIDLNSHFSDPDGDQLEFSIVSCGTAVKAGISGSTLTITAEEPGLAEVSLSASDGNTREPAACSFVVLCMTASDGGNMVTWPSVVSSELNIAMEKSGSARICIYSSTGKCVLDRTVYSSSYKSAATDVSSLAPGRYVLKVTTAETTIKKNIVKI